MDPEANWSEAVALAGRSVDGQALDLDDLVRLAELVLALNSWAINGGFPPKVFAQKK